MYVPEADWIKIQCSEDRPIPLENAMVICVWVEDDETQGNGDSRDFATIRRLQVRLLRRFVPS